MHTTYLKLRISPTPQLVGLPESAQSIDDAQIGFANLVRPGDILAQALAVDAVAARLILKNATEYRSGPGTRTDPVTGNIVASSYGIAGFARDGRSIVVNPPLLTNVDATAAWILIGHGMDGTYPDLPLIYATLSDAGIKTPFAPDVLGPTIATIIEGQKWIPVAAGQPASDGATERFEILVDVETKKSGEDASGRIDYRETRRYISVAVGQPLLRLHPEIPPLPGRDVYGNLVEGKMIRHPVIRIGRNVVSHSDVRAIYVSAIDGLLGFDGRTMQVLPVLQISGDVNLETGNVRFAGSVKVGGSIGQGMLVETGGDIFIDGMIEGGTVIARGSVVVLGGIIGFEKNKVRAGRDIVGRFAQNANLFAGGDILIGQSVVNSFLFSGDTVLVLGDPGVIRSGIVVARSRIEANEAGSDFNLTVLRTGVREEYRERKKTIEENIKVLNAGNADLLHQLHAYHGVVSMDQLPKMIAGMSAEKRARLLPIVQKMAENSEAIRKMRCFLEAVDDRIVASGQSSIVMRRVVHAGVRIIIDEKIKELQHDMPAVTFTPDTL